MAGFGAFRSLYRSGRAQTLARFALVFLLILALSGAIIAFLDYERFAGFRSAVTAAQEQRLDAAAELLTDDLERAISRVRILGNSPSVLDFIAGPTPARRQAVERELFNVIRNSGLYDRVRLLDLAGRELARADYNAGNPTVTPPNRLAGPPEGGVLRQLRRPVPGQVHVGPIAPSDLTGEPVVPVTMVLGIGREQPVALLALDVLGPIVLERFETALGGGWGQSMLLDGRGRVLATTFQTGGSPQPPLAGGDFSAHHPAAWSVVSERPGGRAMTPHGFFLFTTFDLDAIGTAEPLRRDALQWKLVSRVPRAQYDYALFSELGLHWLGTLLLVALSAVLSSVIAWQWTANRRHRQALAASEERLALAFRGANDAVWDFDLRSDAAFLSPRLKTMLGYAEHELPDRFDTWRARVHLDDAHRVEADMRRHLEGGSAYYQSRYRLRHRDGRYIWVHSRGQAQRDAAGRPVRMVGVLSDITEQMRAEEEQRQAAAVFESASEAIVRVGTDGCIRAVNRAFTDITGFTADEAVGRDARFLAADRMTPADFDAMRDGLQQQGRWRGEVWLLRKSGEVFPAWQTVSAVRDERGTVTQYVSVLTDISVIKQTEERLAHLAHHDPLTGLPNRLRFLANLDQALRRAERHGQSVALLFLDLDRFKLINDSLGHETGDRLLQAIAGRLRECVREEDTVARLGGDEFVVVLEELDDPQAAREPAEKIMRAVRQPLQLGSHHVTTSTSVGISVYPHDGRTCEELVKAADVAMYQAKQQGRNTFRYYAPELTRVARDRLLIENGLRRALDREELFLVFQPQVSLRTGRLVGAEALLRWRHPERGVLLPDAFISVAEDSGLIEPIGEWVLRQSCAQAGRWRATGLPLPRLAVNLTVRQIMSQGFLAKVRDIVGAQPRTADRLQLDLEITESTLQTAEDSINILRDLKAAGVGLAIDDFGTGYSSLNSLRKLPIDILKIDRSFVADTPHDADSNAIAAAIVALGHTLRLQVLAEGIETLEQLRFVRAQGCDDAQGYYFSRPLTAAEMEVLLRRQPHWPLPPATPPHIVTPRAL